MVAASNLAELPALFLPVGLSDNGLPVGMQLSGHGSPKERWLRWVRSSKLQRNFTRCVHSLRCPAST